MKKVPLVCLFFALSISVCSSNADPPCPKLEFIAKLDGSASGPSEQEAPPNLSLWGKAFEIRNDIKEPCHVTVSCAYVTALAPRDASAGVDGMIDPPQNSESRKNTNKWLQFAKLESLTLRGRGLIDGQEENLWTGQQRSVAAVKRLRKGRILVEPSDPKGDPGHGPHIINQ